MRPSRPEAGGEGPKGPDNPRPLQAGAPGTGLGRRRAVGTRANFAERGRAGPARAGGRRGRGRGRRGEGRGQRRDREVSGRAGQLERRPRHVAAGAAVPAAEQRRG